MFVPNSNSRSLGQQRLAEAGQLTKILALERDRLALQGGEFRIDPGQQIEAGLGDPGQRQSPIFTRAGTLDQALPFQPIQQAGDVRRAVDQALGYVAPGVTFRVDPPKDAEDVVLVGRDAVPSGELVTQARDMRAGGQDGEPGPFGGAVESCLLQPAFE